MLGVTGHKLVCLAGLSLAAVAALGAAPGRASGGTDGPTCRGIAATIVGEPGTEVTGTDGDDVIVSAGAYEVDAGAGADLICATNVAGPDVDDHMQVTAGPGADVVDTRGNLRVRAYVHLDAGDDAFVGGRGGDRVHASGVDDANRPTADGHDTIRTGPGHDSVVTGGGVESPDGDSIELGVGNDTIEVVGALDPTMWVGADGEDGIVVERALRPVGTWIFDNAAGRATLDGEEVAAWSSFQRFTFYAGRTSGVSFVGSGDGEDVTSAIALDEIDLAGGNDSLELWPDDLAGDGALRIDGGEGSADHLALGRRFNDGDVDLDLAAGTLRFVRPREPGARSSVAGFEQVRVDALWTRVRGTGRTDRIDWNACRGSVAGLGGPDVLRWLPVHETACNPTATPPRIDVLGGRGNDVLFGGTAPDRLLGGPGSDYADGRGGRDLCRAEQTERCERR